MTKITAAYLPVYNKKQKNVNHMKLLFTNLLLATVISATAQTHIEAESHTNSSGVQKLFCAEGATGNKSVQMAAHDWVEYNANISADGIYKISIRAAGTAANIWICTPDWKVLGKVFLQKTFFAGATDQDYSTYTGHVFLKANNDTIRLQARQTAYDFRVTNVLLNWVEIATTNLLVSNNFDSDWDVFTAGFVPWKSTTDSVNSLWESSAGFYGWIKQTARPESFRISTFPTGVNRSTAMFTLAKSDTSTWPNVRAEIYKGYSPSQTLHIAFDFMCPTDITNDGLPHTFVQFHGAGALSPNISLRVENVSGVPKYVMKVLWSAIHNPTTHQGEQTYILGDYEYGVWVKWAIKVRFAYDNTGQLQVYKDGTEVATRLNAPNCYNDDHYSYLKIGIYKWGWNGWASYTPYNELIHYYDNLKIGGAASSIAEVSQND